MTQVDRDFEDILGRTLHAAVDPIEPSGDGLEKIRRRLAEPWLLRQLRLLLTESEGLAWLILIRLEPVRAHLEPLRARLEPVRARLEPGYSRARATVASHAGTVSASLRQMASQIPGLSRLAALISGSARYDAAHRSQGSGQDGSRFRSVLSRLRPVLAVAAAVVIVGTGAFALTQLHATISDIGLITVPNTSAPASPRASASSTGHKRTRHHRHHRSGVPAPAIIPTPASGPTPSPTATCRPTAKPTASPQTSTSAATASANPSATVTDTPTGGTPPTVASGSATSAPPITQSSAQALSATTPAAKPDSQPCG